MNDKSLDLQSIILNHCRREGVPANVFLMKGVRLQGTIGGFDAYVLTLKRDGREQLIYKHGVATLSARVEPTILPDTKVSGGEGLQQSYLDRAVGNDIEVFLMSGVRLGGRLLAHDRYTLVMQTADRTLQLVYKHALSSLSGVRS